MIPIEKLYEICRNCSFAADQYRIGRVIARPFTGRAGDFQRTARRHDFSMKPPRTVLNAIVDANLPVIGVGKISDIFAGEGITNRIRQNRTATAWTRSTISGRRRRMVSSSPTWSTSTCFYGHRRDVAGYAKALQEFDEWLGRFIDKVSPDDLVVITADHGNDPTFRGTDHTREQVPLFVMHNGESRDLGTRSTFADVAASLAEFFQLPEPWPIGVVLGESFRR